MVETMDELIARVQKQLYRLTDLQDATKAILVTETSPDGTVTVEVDANAALVGLSFAPGIAKLTPAELEQTLVDTARTAAHRAFAQRGELITAFNEESTG
ncbi:MULTISPECIES: YbaB/EbfC family nucleoid-associated protein [Nocardia]|uniref:YbaB/EbfC family nucleoid-associated protein n=1 Tax=Nocardia TaxID=1817 RepID=UPI0015EF7EF0|nr:MULTISPECIES: YbaB/EbfC family nucleoid-associated protein [Nocardia]MCA2210187.1 YbaB/EbfC family nucleoid-associated protein [Nocardia rosealba]